MHWSTPAPPSETLRPAGLQRLLLERIVGILFFFYSTVFFYKVSPHCFSEYADRNMKILCKSPFLFRAPVGTLASRVQRLLRRRCCVVELTRRTVIKSQMFSVNNVGLQIGALQKAPTVITRRWRALITTTTLQSVVAVIFFNFYANMTTSGPQNLISEYR